MVALLIFYTVHLLQAQAASGHPVSRATGSTTGWVSEQPGRGTLSIIFSCALTMGLCVYSALHLNILAHGETQTQTQLRYLKWMVLALFGPELVVFCAWRQYASAKTLLARIEESKYSGTDNLIGTTSKGSLESTSDQTRPRWSMIHGFYAGMGGFVFDVNSTLASALPFSKPPPSRLTVTPRGIALLADCGLLPTISEAEIEDKNKSDGTARAIVCLQVAWFLTQTISRVSYNLPVTLLEINTIGHIICALCIYVLWWQKPRLIREPTPLRGDWTESVCAYTWMSSKISDPDQSKRLPWFGKPRIEELTQLVFRPQDVLNQDRRPEKATPINPSFGNEETKFLTSMIVAHKQEYGYLRALEETESPKNSVVANETKVPDHEANSHESPIHWHMALDAMQKFPALINFSTSDLAQTQQHWNRFQADEVLCGNMPNWDPTVLLSNFNGVVMGMALWFASMAFGAVHVAAWKKYFPSHTEAFLWRFSATYITVSGLVWLCINGLGQISLAFDEWWERGLSGGARRPIVVIISFLCTICGTAYAFGRVYLFVEAVISLRKLPVAAYETPNWPDLIPHL